MSHPGRNSEFYVHQIQHFGHQEQHHPHHHREPDNMYTSNISHRLRQNQEVFLDIVESQKSDRNQYYNSNCCVGTKVKRDPNLSREKQENTHNQDIDDMYRNTAFSGFKRSYFFTKSNCVAGNKLSGNTLQFLSQCTGNLNEACNNNNMGASKNYWDKMYDCEELETTTKGSYYLISDAVSLQHSDHLETQATIESTSTRTGPMLVENFNIPTTELPIQNRCAHDSINSNRNGNENTSIVDCYHIQTSNYIFNGIETEKHSCNYTGNGKTNHEFNNYTDKKSNVYVNNSNNIMYSYSKDSCINNKKKGNDNDKKNIYCQSNHNKNKHTQNYDDSNPKNENSVNNHENNSINVNSNYENNDDNNNYQYKNNNRIENSIDDNNLAIYNYYNQNWKKISSHYSNKRKRFYHTNKKKHTSNNSNDDNHNIKNSIGIKKCDAKNHKKYNHNGKNNYNCNGYNSKDFNKKSDFDKLNENDEIENHTKEVDQKQKYFRRSCKNLNEVFTNNSPSIIETRNYSYSKASNCHNSIRNRRIE